jgi:hypothetical protein
MSPNPSGATPPDPAEGRPFRLGPAARARLEALHQLAPLSGWPLLVVHAFLFATATDAELDAAAQAHEAQARQLRDPAIRRALRGAWQVVDPIRFIPGRGRPDLPLADLLALAPPELAAAVRAELAAAGLDPDATDWPPPPPVVG